MAILESFRGQAPNNLTSQLPLLDQKQLEKESSIDPRPPKWNIPLFNPSLGWNPQNDFRSFYLRPLPLGSNVINVNSLMQQIRLESIYQARSCVVIFRLGVC